MKNTVIKFIRLSVSVLFISTFLICNIAACEGVPGPDPNQSSALSSLPKQALPLEVRMQKEVSISAQDLDMKTLVRALAEQAKVDVILSPNVKGDATVTITNVPLEEALKNVLRAYGFDYVIDKNLIRVGLPEEIAKTIERIETKAYKIVYADAAEVSKALDKFKSQQGSVTYVQGTSDIIVTDTESKIKAIDDFLKEVDRITPQVLVEARIYDMSLTDQFDLGVEWFLGRNTNYGASGAGGGSSFTGTNPSSGDTKPFTTGEFVSSIAKSTKTTGLLRFGILGGGIDIDMLLKANQDKIHAKLLADPRVLVLDHETATFKITEERPYYQYTQSPEGSAGTGVGSTEFKEVGVALSVTPHIAAEEKMIRMHIKPSFSVQTGTATITGGGTTGTLYAPVIAKREADTYVMVRDGETVVLGGLRKQEIGRELSKVPFLGDLPLLGRLFRFEGEQTVTSEIVVFITPRIIQRPVMSELETQQFKLTDIKGPEPINPDVKKLEK